MALLLTGRDIVILSSVDWGPLWQSHHEMATRFASAGNRVLFVENMGVRAPHRVDAPRVAQRVNAWAQERGGRRPRLVAPNLHVFSPLVLPPFGSWATRLANRRVLAHAVRRTADRLGMADPIVITWLPTDTALDVIDVMGRSTVCYFCIADFEELVEKRERLVASETELLEKADLVLAHADVTYEKCARVASNVHLVPPSVSVREFALAPTPAEPADPPVIGYVGGLHRVVDFELVAACARMRPDWRWELIGPIQHSLQPLDGLGNVTTPGPLAHDALPRAIAGFDVCVVPYLTQVEHHSVAPTKINEYLSVGKPVVATDLPWVRAFQERHQVLEVTPPDPELFVEAIERSLAASSDRDAAVRRRTVAAESDWSGRVEQVSNLIEESATGKAATGSADNIDLATVRGFGGEWATFDQAPLSPAELSAIFEQYFAVFPWHRLSDGAEGFDLGCGSGRWAQLVAPRVGRLHLVDASAEALDVARRNLEDADNCDFHEASVGSLPFAPSSMEFGYSLGVLHHVPDTAAALRSCATVLRPGAPFLVYLYYAFDNRPAWYRTLWRATEPVRRVVSRLPHPVKLAVSTTIALLVYWPLARLARLGQRLGAGNMPLAYYADRSLYTMRTDAYDRFGTRLEQRFSRAEIESMMAAAGFENIMFSDSEPYWCAVGIRR